jgi:hypothetical protein
VSIVTEKQKQCFNARVDQEERKRLRQVSGEVSGEGSRVPTAIIRSTHAMLSQVRPLQETCKLLYVGAHQGALHLAQLPHLAATAATG